MLPKWVQNNLVEKLSLRENNKNIMIHKNYLGPIVCDICPKSKACQYDFTWKSKTRTQEKPLGCRGALYKK